VDERTQKIEEALSVVWEEREQNNARVESIRKKIIETVKEDVLVELINEGYVTVSGGSIAFTAKGEPAALSIVRRQRLAERLLIDVLELGRGEMDTSACEFEHVLTKEVEESICTLLGHPKECPHGLVIPPGGCCAKAGEQIESLVVALSRFKPGEAARVVYVLTRQHPQLHKLMSLGIVPGALVSVHQSFPAFVIQVGETQIAVEKDIADEIYVKRARE
jgi:DtxR family transcriptional regulator, Mn-dependent transcriptional regulator